uniref:hypothetical protein n=1 Tax=Streptococcus pluranimalium TaxID=82348 RepID=UPI003F693778
MEERITIYLTKEQKEAFKKKCSETNMTMTQIGRLLVMDYIDGTTSIQLKKKR